jgi:ubiquinone/menaquinone biosynthesis C-methylase UbiE
MMNDTNLINKFKERHNTDIVPFYESREDRNRWASSIIREFPGRNLLNLGGGGKRHLGKHLGSQWSVHELDITGDCDTKLNLDQIDRLPFEDEFFDTSCAFEVLEHLEQFHLIASEMYRVSKSTILISLPNAAVEAIFILRNQRFLDDPVEHGVYSKFNGLPLEKPEDRHRWWFTFEDIIRYFVHFEAEKSCTVEFYIPEPDPTIKRKLFRRISGERFFLNFFCTNVWIKISKNTV